MLRLHSTGFVSADAGSVASANAVLLSGLLDRGHKVTFYTKPSFVDPRPALNGQVDSGRFQLVDCTNHWGDGVRRKVVPSGGALWGYAWGQLDAATYNRGLVRAMRRDATQGVDLWLGDWARGRGTRPVVSFVQGAPGTDARSVFSRRDLITRLSGAWTWGKLATAARLRLHASLPPFRHSDHVVVGSSWSRGCLIDRYGLPPDRTHAVPYPIDLHAFSPPPTAAAKSAPLRLLWLGRFAPRKRLDVFLDGLALAIREGADAEAWVVGSSAFAPGFEQLLQAFPYLDRLRHWPFVPRERVPSMLAEVDVMAQPSDEEDFGSSVAEALACGVPAIVGATNGTGDYVCENSIRLPDDRPESFAAAVVEMAERKRSGALQDRSVSRAAAEQWFAPDKVLDRFEAILAAAGAG